MYTVDLVRRTIVPEERSFTMDDEYRLNEDIKSIEQDLLLIAYREEWINKAGRVVVDPGYTHIGSNIVVTYLSSLFVFDDEEKVFSLNEDIAKRFTNNDDSTPQTLMEDVERILRMRYGDVVVERYINRLLYSYYKYDEIEADFLTNEEPGLSLFTKGWWVLFAMQGAMLSYQTEGTQA